MDFYSKRRKVRRQEQERNQSMKDFMEHKEEYDMFHEARAIIYTLSRISCTAKGLTEMDILRKVNSRTELDFYYKWCNKI